MNDLVWAIRQEHRRILDLVDRLAERQERLPIGEHAWRKAVRQIVELESRHEAAEARYLWPVVRDALPEYASIRETALSQEKEARWLLHRLHRTTGSQEAVDLVPKVVQAVRTHVGLEESQVLSVLERRLPPNDSRSLGPQFEEASRLGPTRPHPRTPAIPGILAAAAPVVRRLDRVRDRLRLR